MLSEALLSVCSSVPQGLGQGWHAWSVRKQRPTWAEGELVL